MPKRRSAGAVTFLSASLPLGAIGAAIGAKALAEGAAAMAAAGVALDKVAMTLEASKPSSRGRKKVVKRVVAKKPVAPKKKANTKK